MAAQPHRPNRLEVDASIAEAVVRWPGEWVTVGGIVSAVRTLSRVGGSGVVVTLADFNATMDVHLDGAPAGWMPERDDVVLVAGRVARSGQRTVLRGQLVERYELALP